MVVDAVAVSDTRPSAAVLDVLNGLLEAEQNGLFRFMERGSPYLSRATADIRRPLQEMVKSCERKSAELIALIDSLGGVPVPRGVSSEEQYMAFLSLKFLLPRLVRSKEQCIERYENALSALPDAPPEVKELLMRHMAEAQHEVGVLQAAAEQVKKTKQ